MVKVPAGQLPRASAGFFIPASGQLVQGACSRRVRVVSRPAVVGCDSAAHAPVSIIDAARWEGRVLISTDAQGLMRGRGRGEPMAILIWYALDDVGIERSEPFGI